jgi:hypothetical protein
VSTDKWKKIPDLVEARAETGIAQPELCGCVIAISESSHEIDWEQVERRCTLLHKWPEERFVWRRIPALSEPAVMAAVTLTAVNHFDQEKVCVLDHAAAADLLFYEDLPAELADQAAEVKAWVVIEAMGLFDFKDWEVLVSACVNTVGPCPRCGGPLFPEVAAATRTDSGTKVCEPCGLFEAVEAMNGRLRSQADWPIDH